MWHKIKKIKNIIINPNEFFFLQNSSWSSAKILACLYQNVPNLRWLSVWDETVGWFLFCNHLSLHFTPKSGSPHPPEHSSYIPHLHLTSLNFIVTFLIQWSTNSNLDCLPSKYSFRWPEESGLRCLSQHTGCLLW